MKQCVRRKLPSMMSSLLQSGEASDAAMNTLEKLIHCEMKRLRKLDKATIFIDSTESLTNFDWEKLWLELHRYLPTLMGILSLLVLDPTDNKSVVCLLAAVVLKQRYKHFSIVQQAISLLLYGNGTSKQVIDFFMTTGMCNTV